MVQPNSWLSVQGEGMPIKGNQFNKGNLFIHITVQFPKTQADIPPGALEMMSKVLPGTPKPDVDEDVEEHMGTACTEDEIIRQLKQGQQAARGRQGADTESDSEEGGSPFGGMGGMGGMGGQQVQCQQS